MWSGECKKSNFLLIFNQKHYQNQAFFTTLNKKRPNITICKGKITPLWTIFFTTISKMHKTKSKRLQNAPFKQKCYRFVTIKTGFGAQKVWLFCISKADFFALTQRNVWYILHKVSEWHQKTTDELQSVFSSSRCVFPCV